MQIHSLSLRAGTGALADATSVTVYEADGVTPVSVVYDAEGGVISNPFQTDSDGLASIMLPDGTYVVKSFINGINYTQTLTFRDGASVDVTLLGEGGVGTALRLLTPTLMITPVNNLVQFDYLNGARQGVVLTDVGTLLSTGNVPKGGELLLYIVHGDTLPPDTSLLSPLTDGLTNLTFDWLTEIIVTGGAGGEIVYTQGRTWAEVEIILPPVYWYGDRGVIGGGTTGTYSNVIDYITLTAPGNALSFGTLVAARHSLASVSDGSRGVFLAGNNVGWTNDYVEIATKSNATYFGQLTSSRYGLSAASDDTIGLAAGGYDLGVKVVIDYLTIATPGDALVHGNLTSARYRKAGCSDGYNAFFIGGYNSVFFTTIDTVGFATPADATVYADLTTAVGTHAAVSDQSIALVGGGTDGVYQNAIVTFSTSTPGSSVVFGNLTQTRARLSACGNDTLATFTGGYDGSLNVTTVDSVNFAVPGDAVDFGDLTVARSYLAACSGN